MECEGEMVGVYVDFVYRRIGELTSFEPYYTGTDTHLGV